jgi:stress response protein YsnF
MSPDNNNNKIDWNNLIKKEAIGIDGLDLGEVHEVGDTYIITQKGLINKKRYHIPKSFVESFDGDILKLRVNESEMHGFEETEDHKFEGYSSFKSSDMSKELETKIPVMAENLEVSKRITEDKVDIIKEPVMNTKTVEIELTRETITIERRPVDSSSSSSSNNESNSNTSSLGLSTTTDIGGPVESRTEISIPLKREEPVIVKKPYVKEEVIVRKKPITETKTITENVTHEEIKYDNKNKMNRE